MPMQPGRSRRRTMRRGVTGLAATQNDVPNDASLLHWLRPIALAAKRIAILQTQLANAAPSKVRTSISDVSKRIALTSGGLVASGALLNLDTLVNWMTAPPQTNIIFGSLTMLSPGSNYTVHSPGMNVQVDLVDPEGNRTLHGPWKSRIGRVTFSAVSRKLTSLRTHKRCRRIRRTSIPLRSSPQASSGRRHWFRALYGGSPSPAKARWMNSLRCRRTCEDAGSRLCS
jgi:hypothetical protein